MKARPGDTALIYFGGRVLRARVERKFLFLRRVTWNVNGSQDGERSAWRPVWMMK